MLVIVENPICFVCGNGSWSEVDEDQLYEWKMGELIQNAFPRMCADERELLMTGIHSKCWEKAFGGQNEEKG